MKNPHRNKRSQGTSNLCQDTSHLRREYRSLRVVRRFSNMEETNNSTLSPNNEIHMFSNSWSRVRMITKLSLNNSVITKFWSKWNWFLSGINERFNTRILFRDEDRGTLQLILLQNGVTKVITPILFCSQRLEDWYKPLKLVKIWWVVPRSEMKWSNTSNDYEQDNRQKQNQKECFDLMSSSSLHYGHRTMHHHLRRKSSLTSCWCKSREVLVLQTILRPNDHE